MIIPVEQLSSDILRNIAEDFITRDGTDYGVIELTLDEKVSRILALIKRGEVLISFDEDTESITLVEAREASKLGLLDPE